jgi:hypothetical protein
LESVVIYSTFACIDRFIVSDYLCEIGVTERTIQGYSVNMAVVPIETLFT